MDYLVERVLKLQLNDEEANILKGILTTKVESWNVTTSECALIEKLVEGIDEMGRYV